ncbi:hypothetical protein AKJ55_00425 [candidate division MSBL1 archaeon SCGC-AAA382M17]|uniref:Oxidoreductase molybdopterin-binding domain-containing protein n=2 Tax=candidate division MSBL1 TaxID=215777 RepID=A0A133VMB1_9EURY|nr:hypothetical protein AKJ54_00125 [candidate division MSBL1 archaeon SCGC-AAA382K21]KXB08774.1 hypothetical protein AKJ55_00425 [candidate division MSBL1 archaeon SCGC-AAA382M17]
MSDHISLDSKKNRLPPGQKKKKKFPTLSKGSIPDWPEDWKLRVFGEVEKDLRFSLGDLKNMDEVLTQNQDFHCVTGWSKLGIEWTGIEFSDLLKKIPKKKRVKHVMFHALDGYTTNLPLKVCKEENLLIVWELEGNETPPEHGGPVRTVIESRYAYKGIKWLSEIELMKEHEKGYWEERGYSDSADPWKEERYSE